MEIFSRVIFAITGLFMGSVLGLVAVVVFGLIFLRFDQLPKIILVP